VKSQFQPLPAFGVVRPGFQRNPHHRVFGQIQRFKRSEFSSLVDSSYGDSHKSILPAIWFRSTSFSQHAKCRGYAGVIRLAPHVILFEQLNKDAEAYQYEPDFHNQLKRNSNSCRYSDGWPVTLKFADAVGEVLISGPAISNAPLAFKHYI
jgi:hypothetical protein